jgi:uncharacterized protein YrrD
VREAKDLLKKPVIATTSGQQLGEVDQLLFEPGQHALYGMVIKARDGGPSLLLQREQIRSIGKDAITVEREESTERFDANSTAQHLANTGGHLGGLEVMTEDGEKLGKVDNVMLNEDGTVASYQISSGPLGLGGKRDILPSEVVTAGADAIIIPGEAKR